MTDDVVIYLAIALVAGGFVGWLANAFTIRIPEIVRQLYYTVVICILIYLLFEFLRTA